MEGVLVRKSNLLLFSESRHCIEAKSQGVAEKFLGNEDRDEGVVEMDTPNFVALLTLECHHSTIVFLTKVPPGTALWFPSSSKAPAGQARIQRS